MNRKLKQNPRLKFRLQLGAGIAGVFLLVILLIWGAQPPDSQPPSPPLTPAFSPEPVVSSAIEASPASTVPKNRPPVIVSAGLEPELVFPGTPVKALVEASDPEGDSFAITYRWQRNREDLPEQTGDTLDTSGFHKGDWITVAVTAGDEHRRGEEKMARSVVVHNRPPQITSLPPAGLDDGRFSYMVLAEDPDGDELEFTLEEAPEGMKIDAKSGLLEWRPEADAAAGSMQVRLVASDGDAKAFQTFTLHIKQERLKPEGYSREVKK